MSEAELTLYLLVNGAGEKPWNKRRLGVGEIGWETNAGRHAINNRFRYFPDDKWYLQKRDDHEVWTHILVERG